MVPGCKPHLGTQTAPAHMHRRSTHLHRHSTHMVSEANRHAAPPATHPAVPAALLEQKGDGSDPQRGAQREALTLIFLQTRSCSASLSKLHYSPATNPLRVTSNAGLRKRKPRHILGRSPPVPQPAQHPKPIAPQGAGSAPQLGATHMALLQLHAAGTAVPSLLLPSAAPKLLPGKSSSQDRAAHNCTSWPHPAHPGPAPV